MCSPLSQLDFFQGSMTDQTGLPLTLIYLQGGLVSPALIVTVAEIEYSGSLSGNTVCQNLSYGPEQFSG